MWTEKTPEEISADINSLLWLMESEPSDALVMPRDHWVHFAALMEFGERVNRANRHKFRRVKLRILQSL